MNTRRANLDDFEALYSLWQTAELKLYPKQDELQRYQSMISTNPDICLILEKDNQIVGSVLGAFDGRTASIHRVAIHPELQKHGYGRQLIDQVEKILGSKGVKKVSAQIHVSNTEVLPFYEKLGFQEMDYVKTYYKEL